MTFRSIFAQGRLSECFGNRTLQVDIMMRDTGLPEVASHAVAKMKKENQDAFEDLSAFAEGINDGVHRRLVLPI
jgi:acyl-homoserine lactone acylase PvdQ